MLSLNRKSNLQVVNWERCEVLDPIFENIRWSLFGVAENSRSIRMIFYYDEQLLNDERMSVYYFVSKVYQSRESSSVRPFALNDVR